MELPILPAPKLKKGRVPRKVKKEWKKDPYFSIFGHMWIREYKWNNSRKALEQYWGYHVKTNFASVRDTGESIQGTNLYEKLQ